MKKLNLTATFLLFFYISFAQDTMKNWLPDSKNSTATHNYTELYFYSDSITPLVNEEIVISYNSNYDGKSYVYHESKFTNEKGKIEVMHKSGMYKFYWKRFGIKKYAWMHAITLETAKDGKYTDAGHSILVNWYKRTFLKVKYENNSNEIPASAIEQMKGLATYLKKNKDIKIELLGHCSEFEKDNENLYASKQRAEAVVQYLIKEGVSANRINSRGNGNKDLKALKNRKATRIEVFEL